MTYIYISAELGVQSSGGLVSSHELEAMKKLSSETNDEVKQLSFQDINPVTYGLKNLPFLVDALAIEKLIKMDLTNVKLVHFYGDSYSNTTQFLKSKGIITSYSVMWHDRKTTIEEHQKFMGGYNFIHVKDDTLFKMYTEGIRHADLIIAAGLAPKNNMLKEGAKRVEIIPLGCNIPEENTIKSFPNEFRTGYIGAWGADKGLYYLIKAWESLNYQDGSRLIFAGPQSEKVLPDFIRQHAKTGNFHIQGFVNNVADFYNNVSVYVQPSATEGFGMTVIQAMSYGRPVICSEAAGVADCIIDEVDGFVISAMNPKAIADKINWFKQHPNKIIEFGKKARENSFKYTWENTEQKYINLWRSLIRDANSNIGSINHVENAYASRIKFQINNMIKITTHSDNKRVLNIGCADCYPFFVDPHIHPGETQIQLPLDLDVLHIDIDQIPESIKAKVNFQIMDAHKLPCKDKEFGCGLLGDILEHVTDPVQVLREAKRVSKNIYITVPNEYGWGKYLKPFQNPGHIRHYTYETLIKDLNEGLGKDNYHIEQYDGAGWSFWCVSYESQNDIVMIV